MHKRRGFTLLEILIVVGIIAILLVLLYPAFGKVKIQIKRTKCLTNIKQIMLALRDYHTAYGGKLPPGGQPYGAIDPTNAAKYLNEFLVGQGYAVLECPADQNNAPGKENSLFQDQGYSYYYLGQDGAQAMSGIVGSVSWQEEKMGYFSGPITIKEFHDKTAYNSPGPEDGADYQSRARDVTRQEIDDYWYTKFVPFIQGLANREGFYIPGALQFPYVVARHDVWVGVPPNQVCTHPKWNADLDANGNVVTVYVPDVSGNIVGSPPPAGYSNTTGWGRNTYNYDYWLRASKKVGVLDWDGNTAGPDPKFSYNVPGSNGTSTTDAYPKRGMGFWHQYNYVDDPDHPGDVNYKRVKVHAGFLDGHAAPIEMNKYTTIDRDNHDYY
ncbi:MAG: type II secretion system protein [Phycisphaerae bacterium]|nr:type II secretion system protein [Phycisphaerae bacterium]